MREQNGAAAPPMFVAYVRPVAWRGPWKFLMAASRKTLLRESIDILLYRTPEGEVAMFECRTWPKEFTDGNEPGRLVYQVTSRYKHWVADAVGATLS